MKLIVQIDPISCSLWPYYLLSLLTLAALTGCRWPCLQPVFVSAIIDLVTMEVGLLTLSPIIRRGYPPYCDIAIDSTSFIYCS